LSLFFETIAFFSKNLGSQRQVKEFMKRLQESLQQQGYEAGLS
jgi:uncharacterized protein (UPF0297 family)